MCILQGRQRLQDTAEAAAWTSGAHRWQRPGVTASQKLPAARAGRRGTRATAASRRSPVRLPLCSPTRPAFSMVGLPSTLLPDASLKHACHRDVQSVLDVSLWLWCWYGETKRVERRGRCSKASTLSRWALPALRHAPSAWAMPSSQACSTLCPRKIEYGASAAGFEAETEDELSVVPGDEVTVQVEVEGWVQITRDRDGKKGLVPASYLQPA